VRTLWVLRHAKAVPHSPAAYERKLAARGRRQCVELADHLSALKGSKPRLVLTSSAARALQTAEGVIGALPGAEIEVERDLYLADPDDVVKLVRLADDAHAHVMVVGHNPTALELLLLLLDPDDAKGRQQLDVGLPTAALARVRFDAKHWGQVSPGQGRLVDLYIPKAR